MKTSRRRRSADLVIWQNGSVLVRGIFLGVDNRRAGAGATEMERGLRDWRRLVPGRLPRCHLRSRRGCVVALSDRSCLGPLIEKKELGDGLRSSCRGDSPRGDGLRLV